MPPISIKGNSKISLDTPYDVNVVSVRQQLDAFLKNCTIAMYSCFPQNILHDKVEEISCCLKPSTISKGAWGFIPILTELQKLFNVIRHSHISFSGISSSDIAAKTRSLITSSSSKTKNHLRRLTKTCIRKLFVLGAMMFLRLHEGFLHTKFDNFVYSLSHSYGITLHRRTQNLFCFVPLPIEQIAGTFLLFV